MAIYDHEEATGDRGLVTPKTMLSEQRRYRILEILKAEPFLRVSELERLLNTSQASVRRDLRALAEAGLLKRTHGGAARNEAATFELPLVQKEDRFRAEKTAIARVAASLVADGETVILDSGTTTLEIARLLKLRPSVRIVTNALNIAWELAPDDIEVTLTGGTIRRNTLALVGPFACNTLVDLHADKLFLATNGLDLKGGVTSPSPVEAQTKKAMLESAGEVILVTDHSKIGRIAFTQVCSLSRLHCVITDAGAPPDFLHALERMRIRVLTAGDAEAPEPAQS